ncbi:MULTISPECIES: UDP-N-acetylmuramate dehydrogenase [unclassified Kaistella]|uniref:UDP-N-acetylmuramate dehydrogenase n=1 Tax=unclassified Kaistella TaxID=2762626 RepID=UPI0027366EFA|nr:MULTISPECIES: UDP-N-acetylmuramate dehydrogenase [unclassified Kaistella]MDP2454237.1 UDP-N-acetylmuramate dehydrogenase [Kaistella sp. SH11-4b]MDP2457692.1 UDP-N-acetylmuramate dehydrogenase [Kaistella sp. SH40-3]MDP2460450.1 UDP-N-acetylmuramate dehydrogenase [Kaistella sp. SH19-2b]
MDILENYSLKNHNTFGVDVSAKYFAEVKSLDALTQILRNTSVQKFKLLFLGGGSNVLFTQDFDGVVLQLNLKGISEKILNDNEVLVTSQAGENWHEFVQFCLNKNYGGLENLSLIPGNVGTSPMQNIGAYGTEIKDRFVSCKVLNLETLVVEIFNHEKCNFGYRESIFKREGKGKYVILDVTFKLTRKDHLIKTEYGAIQSELKNLGIENPTIQEVSKAVINIRQSKLPDPKVIGNAGSFFKNPSIPMEQFLEVQKLYPEMPHYPNGDLVKVPAGWLIEQCGWKGKQIGNVASHELQSLVIVNKTGLASGKEIYDFSTTIIESVREKFGIDLEREVNII